VPSAPASSRVIDGKYALMRELGSGAAGTVFAAEHLIVGKRVAVKVLDPVLSRDPALQARFVAEARAAARIGHANVVDIHDLGIARDGTSYMVMELIEGETLEEVLASRGAIAPAYACELMLQVLAGLGAAHAKGIVHCDLKPANVIVTHPRPDRPHVKVLDFGIARGVVEAAAPHHDIVCGTPLYMAPEQALGLDVDQRADVYAASAMLFEMLAGRTPYEGAEPSEVLARVLAGSRPTLADLKPDLPAELVAVVEAGLKTDPRERIASAEELSERLMEFVSPLFNYSLRAARSGTPEPIPLVASTKQEREPVFINVREPAAPMIVLDPPSESLLIAPRIPRLAGPPRLDAAMPRGAIRLELAEARDRQAQTTVPRRSTFTLSDTAKAAFAAMVGFAIGAATLWLAGAI
jgi:eukaryotic-like serine/threonine-protein kinase